MVEGAAAAEPPSPQRCAWLECPRAATVQVLTGDLLRRRRRPHGCYCAPHSVATSRELRARAAVDVWFAVIRADRREAG